MAAVASAPLPGLTLVLGGARSGKSHYAEGLVLASGLAPVYLATASASDSEMAERIAAHRARRGARWRDLEVGAALAPALRAEAAADRALLVDCLTLWLGRYLVEGRDVAAACAELTALLPTLPGRVVMVSNEVGLGIVPENALARAFRDAAGALHQAIAAVAGRVVLIAAGLPLVLKETCP
jgi:adenosylcobinamide kinase/adenosylcobinamide-phosphate guanylyltransferase